MPEGPTIVILRDEVARFTGQKILGETDRRSFFCERCQVQFGGRPKATLRKSKTKKKARKKAP